MLIRHPTTLIPNSLARLLLPQAIANDNPESAMSIFSLSLQSASRRPRIVSMPFFCLVMSLLHWSAIPWSSGCASRSPCKQLAASLMLMASPSLAASPRSTAVKRAMMSAMLSGTLPTEHWRAGFTVVSTKCFARLLLSASHIQLLRTHCCNLEASRATTSSSTVSPRMGPSLISANTSLTLSVPPKRRALSKFAANNFRAKRVTFFTISAPFGALGDDLFLKWCYFTCFETMGCGPLLVGALLDIPRERTYGPKVSQCSTWRKKEIHKQSSPKRFVPILVKLLGSYKNDIPTYPCYKKMLHDFIMLSYVIQNPSKKQHPRKTHENHSKPSFLEDVFFV